MRKKPYTLAEHLEELERTDPDVKRASENYDRMARDFAAAARRVEESARRAAREVGREGARED